ncbi:helix-turn-helix domain-containing protein [Streptomyces sp. NPDC004609]|uniref:helix-turn-helix domain-containing protein n=1 Tax=Streptomyces sp. NPDC004609 TaxID=3364704 RepID=UPI0036A47019
MTSPAPLGEPFAEASTEAAQSAAMAVRLILTVTDVVRRAARRHRLGKDTEDGPGLGEDATKPAPGWAAATLHRRFRAATGMSPLRFQEHLRLQEARRLLTAGDTTGARVAEAVG